jgi:hypothetical protein
MRWHNLPLIKMSFETDNIAIIIGSIIIVVLFIFLFVKSRSSSSQKPTPAPAPAPPAPAPISSFSPPVQSYKLLTLKNTGTTAVLLTIETPVALFLYDSNCNCEPTKAIFQTFAGKNSEYYSFFEMNRSIADTASLVSAFSLQSQTLPAVLIFEVGVKVATVTQITDTALTATIKPTSFKTPVVALQNSDIDAQSGKVLTAPDQALIFVYDTPCPKCDAEAVVVQAFASLLKTCKVYSLAKGDPTFVPINTFYGPITTFPRYLAFSAGILSKDFKVPTVLTVDALLSQFSAAPVTDFIFVAPADGVIDSTRWNTNNTFKFVSATKPTLIFVYNAATTKDSKIAFQTFANQNPTLATYETLNTAISAQNDFFAVSKYPVPDPLPVVIKYDIGGLPSKDVSRDFSSTGLAPLTKFNFVGLKSVAKENFLIAGTNTATASFVSAAPVVVFVYSDTCDCEAKKRVFQQVFDKTQSTQMYVANSSDTETAAFFTQTKLSPTTVAIHKWLKTTGTYSPDPILAAFDEATVTAYLA